MGAILVLGPDVPIVSRAATALDRRCINNRFEELKEKGKLTANVEPFDRVFREMWKAESVPFTVEEMVIDDGRVILGAAGLEDGERTGLSIEEFQTWIDNYRGIEREYYLAGGGLLLMGFLFQIMVQAAEISLLLGLVSLSIVLCIGTYLLYRTQKYMWWTLPVGQ